MVQNVSPRDLDHRSPGDEGVGELVDAGEPRRQRLVETVTLHECVRRGVADPGLLSVRVAELEPDSLRLTAVARWRRAPRAPPVACGPADAGLAVSGHVAALRIVVPFPEGGSRWAITEVRLYTTQAERYQEAISGH